MSQCWHVHGRHDNLTPWWDQRMIVLDIVLELILLLMYIYLCCVVRIDRMRRVREA